MVTLAALRAYVPLVDPHSDFAPLDEQWALYAGDATLDAGSPLWADVIRTSLGARVVDDPAPPLQIDDLVLSLDALLADGRRGRMVREGAQVVIAGRPNVGKSTLFNALTGVNRAIVTAVPGTTRDLITERIDVNGLPITLVDTAGVRDTLDVVEQEGVARGDRAREVADVVLVVLDAGEGLAEDDERLLARTRDHRRLVIVNKADLPFQRVPTVAGAVAVSATTGAGIETLRAAIVEELTGSEARRDSPAISNTRHIALLESARLDLARARTSAAAPMPEEFVLGDLQAARERFDDVVGRRTSDDVLAHVFERFCIGK
jgi:tRNA modification GTPase